MYIYIQHGILWGLLVIFVAISLLTATTEDPNYSCFAFSMKLRSGGESGSEGLSEKLCLQHWVETCLLVILLSSLGLIPGGQDKGVVLNNSLEKAGLDQPLPAQ